MRYILRFGLQCDSGLGTRMLYDQLFHEPQKLLTIGPACSTDGQSIADVAHYWNLLTVSYVLSIFVVKSHTMMIPMTQGARRQLPVGLLCCTISVLHANVKGI